MLPNSAIKMAQQDDEHLISFIWETPDPLSLPDFLHDYINFQDYIKWSMCLAYSCRWHNMQEG